MSIYMRDMASFSLLDVKEEVSAFKILEAAEAKTVYNMSSWTDVVASEAGLILDHLDKEGEDTSEARKAVRALATEKGRRTLSTIASRCRWAARLQCAVMGRYVETDDSMSDAGKPVVPGRWIEKVRGPAASAEAAKNKIVEANLRLVIMVANRQGRRGNALGLQDLIQEGNLGLIRAAEKFSHRRGVKFATYAIWWIRQSMKRATDDRGRVVRIPVHVSDAMARLAKAEKAHYSRTGSRLENPEAEKLLGISAKKLLAIKSARPITTVSLDDTHDRDGDSLSLSAIIPDPEAESPCESIEKTQLAVDLRDLILILTPMESKIIKWRFAIDGIEPLTLQQIADKYSLSRERIRQLEVRAMRKLQKKAYKLSGHANHQHGL